MRLQIVKSMDSINSVSCVGGWAGTRCRGVGRWGDVENPSANAQDRHVSLFGQDREGECRYDV